MSSSFTPPRPDQWEGPSKGFTPPPVSSWEGPSSSQPYNAAQRGAKMKGTAEMPRTFMGTLVNDISQIPSAVGSFVQHPWETAKGALESFQNLPETNAQSFEGGHPGEGVARMAEVGAPAVLDLGGKTVGAARSAASAVGKIARTPGAADVVGVISPRAGNAMRVVGRGANLIDKVKSALETLNAPAATTVDPMLEGLSQAQLGKKYANATAQEQAAIQQLAARLNGAPAPVGTAPVARSYQPPPAPPPELPTEAAPRVGSPLRPPMNPPPPDIPSPQWVDVMRANPVRPPLGSPPPPPPGMAEAAPSLLGTPPKRAEVTVIPSGSASRQAATAAPKEAAARAVKVQKLAQTLEEHGISPEDAGQIEDAHWNALAKSLEIRIPSATTKRLVVQELNKMRATKSMPEAELPEHLRNNPKAAAAARALRDMLPPLAPPPPPGSF